MIDKVLSAATRNPQFAVRITDAERRILEAKAHLGLLRCAS
jgi:hypothetical protein